MANDAWTNRTQAQTLQSATKWGEGWTLADLNFVEAFANDVTDAELAEATGRTLFAIQSIKHAIRAGRAGGEGPARRARAANAGAYRGWTEDMGDGWGA